MNSRTTRRVARPPETRDGDEFFLISGVSLGDPLRRRDWLLMLQSDDATTDDLAAVEVAGIQEAVVGFLHVTNTFTCQILDYNGDDQTGDHAAHEIKIIGRCVRVLRGRAQLTDVRGVRPIREIAVERSAQ